jgi:hypothetical protein
MLAATWYAGRVDTSLRWWPFAGLVAVVAPLAIVATVAESGAAGPWSLVSVLVASAAVVAGLRLMSPAFDAFAVAELPATALLIDVASIVVFLLVSPLGAALGAEPAADRLAFGAIVVGLTLLIAAVLGGIVMSHMEDALRSSTELATVSASRRARSRDTPG